MLQLSFKIIFEKDCVNVLLGIVCYGSGFMLDGFIVLDSIPINTNTSTFVNGCSNNDSLVHDVKWHARLGHIGQDRLKKVDKAGLLGSIEKNFCQFVSTAWQEKQLDWHLARLRESLSLYNLFIMTSVTQ